MFRKISTSPQTAPFFPGKEAAAASEDKENASPNAQKVSSFYSAEDDKCLEFEEDVHLNSTLRKVFSKHSSSLFMQKVAEKVGTDLFIFEKRNVTHPKIISPSKRALEIHALYYEKKYGIIIRLTTCKDLLSQLQKVEHTIRPPCYVSFMVTEDAAGLEEGHVLPLLCSFGSHGKEFLIMDVIGKEDDEPESMVKRVHAILCQATDEKNILISVGGRQSDTSSCRTGALSLLRNAHLSLRYHRFLEGLKEPIQRLVSEPLNPLEVKLPSEWTYVEQIFRGDVHQLAIRDLFSSKTDKRAHPRTVELFRKAHAEPITFHCSLRNSQDYTPSFEKIAPPPGVIATISKDGFEIQFRITLVVNTYLFHKAHRRAAACAPPAKVSDSQKAPQGSLKHVFS